MGGKRSSDYSNDSSKVPNQEVRNEVTGTSFPDGEFAKDVYLKGVANGVKLPVELTSTEDKPTNVQPMEEIVPEDVIAVTGGITLEEAQSLFNKTNTVPVVMPYSVVFTMFLKKPFRSSYAYPVLNNIFNPDILLELRDIHGNWASYNVGGTLTQVDTRINAIRITNMAAECSPTNVTQIIVEMFYARDVNGGGGVTSSEAEPIHSEEHQTLIAEDCEAVKCILNGAPLSEDDLKRLFNKHSYGANPIVVRAGLFLDLPLKIPIRLKNIKAVGNDNRYIGDGLTVCQLGAFLPTGITKSSYIQPLLVGEEVIEIIVWAGASDIALCQIVAEKYFDIHTDSPSTEAVPVHTEEHQTLIAEDFELMNCYLNGNNLTQAQLDRITNKHTSIGDPLIIEPYGTLALTTKVSTRVCAAKALNSGNAPIGSGATVSMLDFNDVLYTSLPNQSLYELVEVREVNIYNPSDSDLPIYQVVVEKYFDNQSSQRLDGRTYLAYDDGKAVPVLPIPPQTPLTTSLVEFPFGFTPQSWDLVSKENPDPTIGHNIYWSWDGIKIEGILVPGASFGEDTHHRSVWLMGEVGGELYEVLAR